MRAFIDMWIRSIDDKMVDLLSKMKYRAAAVEGLDFDEPIVKNNLVLVKKVVVEASSRDELIDKLRGAAKKGAIISVKPRSVEAARAAAHDTRVSTLILDFDSVDYLDKPQCSLMKQHRKPVEISMKIFYGSLDLKLKAMIYRRINYYLNYTKQPLIVSSGASSWSELVDPRSAISLLSILFGVDKRRALSFLTTYPREILVYSGVSL